MEFDYVQLKNKLNEDELKTVKSYVDNNKNGILKELEHLDQQIEVIPISAVLEADSLKTYHSFGFVKDNNNIIVELIK